MEGGEEKVQHVRRAFVKKMMKINSHAPPCGVSVSEEWDVCWCFRDIMLFTTMADILLITHSCAHIHGVTQGDIPQNTSFIKEPMTA